jgi:hypothetical protein
MGGPPLRRTTTSSVQAAAAGYSADTVILAPVDSLALDLLLNPTDGYYFAAMARSVSAPAGGPVFGLNIRVSKAPTVPVVLDASAAGKLYVGPVGFARFEENAGQTNTSTVRLEGSAQFGVERVNAMTTSLSRADRRRGRVSSAARCASPRVHAIWLGRPQQWRGEARRGTGLLRCLARDRPGRDADVTVPKQVLRPPPPLVSGTTPDTTVLGFPV